MLTRFSERFDSVMRYYPELHGEIKIGMTTSYNGLAVTRSDGDTRKSKLCFPPLKRKGLPSRYVMGHEIMHLVQHAQDSLPGTERSCDIFTLARLPPRFIDHPPIYLSVPPSVRRPWVDGEVDSRVSELAHEIAIEAVITRPENPHYIQWWENEFAGRLRDSPRMDHPANRAGAT